jgi:hypothetical protein
MIGTVCNYIKSVGARSSLLIIKPERPTFLGFDLPILNTKLKFLDELHRYSKFHPNEYAIEIVDVASVLARKHYLYLDRLPPVGYANAVSSRKDLLSLKIDNTVPSSVPCILKDPRRLKC